MSQLQIDLRHPRVKSRRVKRPVAGNSAMLYILGGLNLVLWIVLGLLLAATLG